MSAAALAYSTADYLRKWSEIEERCRELEGPSLEDELVSREINEPGYCETFFDELEPDDWTRLAFEPEYFLRPKQLAVMRSSAFVIFFVAGRRMGKTLTAAEWVWSRIQNGARTVVLVGPNYDDIEAFMVGGHKKRIDGGNGSGLLDILPPSVRYEFFRDAHRIEFPDYGAVVHLHSAEVAEFRGHGVDTVWGDEIIKWRFAEKLLTNLRIACSNVGKVEPQLMLTTSPKRLKILRDLVMDPEVETFTGLWSENLGNVNVRAYESAKRGFTDRTGNLTRQGLEEMGGKLGVDEEGDLFPLGVIEANRVEEVPELALCIVSLDPAGSKKRTSDEVGLIAMGRAGDIDTGDGYVLEDRTKKYAPEEWGDESLVLAEKWGASMILLEGNRFGDLAAMAIRTMAQRRGYSVRAQPGAKTLTELVHDRDGVTRDGKPLKATGRIIKLNQFARPPYAGDKATQATPTSNLYKTGRMHHLGVMPDVDAELSDFDPSSGMSPGRLDAIVNGANELFQLDRPPDVDGPKMMKGLAEANKKLDESASGHGAQWLAIGDDSQRAF